MGFAPLASMTWPQAGAVTESRSVGLVPTGAVEQHGPHLPLATDSLIAEHLARRVAERAAETIVVTPVIRVGRSDHHSALPGTITVSDEVFTRQLEAYVRTLAAMGLEEVALISSHGGNFGVLERFPAGVSEMFPGVRIAAYADFRAYLAAMVRGAESCGVSVPDTDIHAGALETSQALHLFPELVRPFEDVVGYTAATEGWLDVLFADGVQALSANGVLGDPPRASAAVGAAVMDALTDEIHGWMSREFSLEPTDGGRV